MKTYAICPISDKIIDERVARITASFTVLVLLLSGLFQTIGITIFLSMDFFLRAYGFEKFSPLALLSKSIVRTFNLNKININAGPKMFAARIGFIFTLLIVVFAISGKTSSAYIAGAILGTFCFLEAAFGFCVACKIYPYANRFLNKTTG